MIYKFKLSYKIFLAFLLRTNQQEVENHAKDDQGQQSGQGITLGSRCRCFGQGVRYKKAHGVFRSNMVEIRSPIVSNQN